MMGCHSYCATCTSNQELSPTRTKNPQLLLSLFVTCADDTHLFYDAFKLKTKQINEKTPMQLWSLVPIFKSYYNNSYIPSSNCIMGYIFLPP